MARPSPLTEGRGLKHDHREHANSICGSPLTEGRGLKLIRGFRVPSLPLSPLTEGRGLKLILLLLHMARAASPLTEGRGLKPERGHLRRMDEEVAPHRGAWIETKRGNSQTKYRGRRPSQRGVD